MRFSDIHLGELHNRCCLPLASTIDKLIDNFPSLMESAGNCKDMIVPHDAAYSNDNVGFFDVKTFTSALLSHIFCTLSDTNNSGLDLKYKGKRRTAPRDWGYRSLPTSAASSACYLFACELIQIFIIILTNQGKTEISQKLHFNYGNCNFPGKCK